MNSAIAHIKATLERPKTSDVYQWNSVTEENFDGFNVSFHYFEKYIQDVYCTEIVESIILTKHRNSFKQMCKWKKDPLMREVFNIDHPVFFNSDEEKLKKEIVRYEKEQKLVGLHTINNGFLKKYYKILKKRGFYFLHAGLQEYEFNEKFLRHFGNEKISAHALKEDFEYAYDCIKPCQPNEIRERVEFRRKNFRENFMENFEHGASYLWLE